MRCFEPGLHCGRDSHAISTLAAKNANKSFGRAVSILVTKAAPSAARSWKLREVSSPSWSRKPRRLRLGRENSEKFLSREGSTSVAKTARSFFVGRVVYTLVAKAVPFPSRVWKRLMSGNGWVWSRKARLKFFSPPKSGNGKSWPRRSGHKNMGSKKLVKPSPCRSQKLRQIIDHFGQKGPGKA